GPDHPTWGEEDLVDAYHRALGHHGSPATPGRRAEPTSRWGCFRFRSWCCSDRRWPTRVAPRSSTTATWSSSEVVEGGSTIAVSGVVQQTQQPDHSLVLGDLPLVGDGQGFATESGPVRGYVTEQIFGDTQTTQVTTPVDRAEHGT